MKNFSEYMLESIKKLNDDNIDKAISNKDVITFEYNMVAIMDFGKTTNVYVTEDKKYFHIERLAKDKNTIEDKIKKYKLIEVK